MADKHAKAIANTLQAFAQNMKKMDTVALNKLTEHILKVSSPAAILPDESNGAMNEFEEVPGHQTAKQTRAIMARIERKKNRRGRGPKGLNGFIAFRSYHQAAFVGFEQKNRSGMLNRMWRLDPQQDLWKMLGAAWSYIRDTTGEVPLAFFTAEVIGILGIIPSNQYLETMGWAVLQNSAGELDVQHHATVARDEVPRHSPVSVDEIVAYCDSIGLSVKAMDFNARPAPGGMLAFTTQGSTAVNGQANTIAPVNANNMGGSSAQVGNTVLSAQAIASAQVVSYAQAAQVVANMQGFGTGPVAAGAQVAHQVQAANPTVPTIDNGGGWFDLINANMVAQ